MTKILHVTCSPLGQASRSYRLSQKVTGCLLKSYPTATVANRVIGGGAISHIDGSYAAALGASQQSPAEISSGRVNVPVRRADSRAGEFGFRGHWNSCAQLHRSICAESVDRSYRSNPSDVQHDQGRLRRPATRSSGLCRRVFGWKIFRGARAPARLSDSLSEGDPGYHRTA